MDVQLNTDGNVNGREDFARSVNSVIQDSLSRFAHRITRVEVHLSDQNGAKGGSNDKRCVMEARLKGRAPLAVTHTADSIDGAISGAVAKLSRAVETVVERLRNGGR